MPEEPQSPSPEAESPSPEKPARAPKAQADSAATQTADKPAKAEKPPKKEKPPALEDKPFAEFIEQHYLPGLTQTLAKFGINDLKLAVEKRPLPIRGMEEAGACTQVLGQMDGGKRQFIIGFLKDDIQGQKFFSWADNGSHPSTLESFMIDERKVSLDLMLLYTVQRLNGQKWLTRN
jgi:hypothetical protein